MFILQGVTLLVMDKPGGEVPPGLGELLLGDAVPGLLQVGADFVEHLVVRMPADDTDIE